MSAGAREAHEAALWRIFTRNGVTRQLATAQQQKLMADLLDAGDAYAADVIATAPDLGRARLAIAAAEVAALGRTA
jgi:hypothetical protein